MKRLHTSAPRAAAFGVGMAVAARGPRAPWSMHLPLAGIGFVNCPLARAFAAS